MNLSTLDCCTTLKLFHLHFWSLIHRHHLTQMFAPVKYKELKNSILNHDNWSIQISINNSKIIRGSVITFC